MVGVVVRRREAATGGRLGSMRGHGHHDEG
jgi:hypothetical protein